MKVYRYLLLSALAVWKNKIQNIFMQLFVAIFCFLVIMTLPLHAEDANMSAASIDQNITKDASRNAKGELLVKRIILVLDFDNVQKNPDYSFLQESLSDTIRNDLIKTGSFEVLNRKATKTLFEQPEFKEKIKNQKSYDEDFAQQIRKAAEADVVVMGKFVSIKDSLRIYTAAVETTSGRTMAGGDSSIPVDNTMFAQIEKLSSDLAGNMKEKLPPIPQKVVVIQVAEKANWDNKIISIGISPGFLLNSEFGCAICEAPLAINARFWPFAGNSGNGPYLGLKLNYTLMWNGDSKIVNNSAGFLDGVIFAGYSFNVGRFLFNADLGAGYFSTMVEPVIRNPMFELKLGGEILISSALSLGINLYTRMYYDKPDPVFFWGIGPVVNFAFGKK